jgi:hypothetical protein
MPAIDGEKIQEAGIHNLYELTRYVPNLFIAENTVNNIIYMHTG